MGTIIPSTEREGEGWQVRVGAGNNCFSFSSWVWGLHFVADSFLGVSESSIGYWVRQVRNSGLTTAF